jgi:hypothetical protein
MTATTAIRQFRPARLVGIVCAVAAFALVVPACGGDDGSKDASTTTRRPTTSVTTTPVTTAAPATSVTESTATAVWPWIASSTRYSDPVAAARGFATDLVGFTEPVMGEFRQGDARSGEVDVRPRADRTPTTVLVRLINGSWWVLGSTTPEIQVSAPAAGATISSPVAMAGTSTAFEATVNVHLVADGAADTPAAEGAPATPLASTFVMGGSMGDLLPFNGTLDFASPGAGTSGALVFLTFSPEDGRVVNATTVRVHFA